MFEPRKEGFAGPGERGGEGCGCGWESVRRFHLPFWKKKDCEGFFSR